MNKKEFAKLCFNYNKEPNEELFELWNENLRCYDEDEISKAINTIISQDKFFPTLSRLLEAVKDVVSKENIDYDSEEFIKEKMKRFNIHTDWLDKEIINEEIDEETQKEFDDFNVFLEEFRNE